MSKGNKGWLWGAAIGTIVGSVTALLFAPKPGRELRKDIADGARQVSEKTQEVASKVSEQSAQVVSKVKETAGNLISEIHSRREGKAVEEAEVKEAQVSFFLEEPGSTNEVIELAITPETEEESN